MRKLFCAMLAAVIVCAAFTGCSYGSDLPAAAVSQGEKPSLVGNIPVAFPLVSAPGL